jgi:hypothetical protein
MACDNCGKVQPAVTVQVNRHRPEGGSHSEVWCLECLQGKNELREQYYMERR